MDRSTGQVIIVMLGAIFAVSLIVTYNVWSTTKSDEAYYACLKANQKIAETRIEQGSISSSLPTCWRR